MNKFIVFFLLIIIQSIFTTKINLKSNNKLQPELDVECLEGAVVSEEAGVEVGTSGVGSGSF
jgi:hypothetical protein